MDTSVYCRKNLGLLLIVCVFSALIQFCSTYFQIAHGYRNADHGYTLVLILLNSIMYLFSSAVFWYVIYKVFNNCKASVVAFLSGLLAFIVPTLLTFFWKSEHQSLRWIFSYVIYAIPEIVYIYLVTKNSNKTIIVGLLMLILSVTAITFTGLQRMGAVPRFILELADVNYNTINKILGFNYHIGTATDSYSTIEYLPIILMAFVHLTYFLLKFEIIRIFSLFNLKDIWDTKLDLSANYSKSQMALLFITTRIAIDATLVGFVSVQAYRYSYFERNSINLIYIIWVIGGLLTLLLFLWLHRKYLCEFLIAYDKVPSWFYWVLLIPILNLIIFPLGLSSFYNKLNKTERADNLKNALSLNSSSIIGSIIMIIQGISLIVSLFNGQYLVAGIKAVVMFLVILFVLGRRYSYYVLFGFYVLLTLVILLSKNLIDLPRSEILGAIYPLAIVSIYLMYAIFFIDRFSPYPLSQSEEIESKEQNNLE